MRADDLNYGGLQDFDEALDCPPEVNSSHFLVGDKDECRQLKKLSEELRPVIVKYRACDWFSLGVLAQLRIEA